MKRCSMFLCWLVCLVYMPWLYAQDCGVRIQQTYVAKSNAKHASDVTHWQEVQLPDKWTTRWPEHSGLVWYRVDWQNPCPKTQQHLGLYINGLSLAHEIYNHNQLLWADEYMVEPLSRSWNAHRLHAITQKHDQFGIQHLYIKVVGNALHSPGIAEIRLDEWHKVLSYQQQKHWNQHTLFLINAILSFGLGLFCACIWLMRKQEVAWGWYVVASLSWLGFLWNILTTQTHPFPNSTVFLQFHIGCFVIYTLSFCIFTWRFVNRRFKKTERCLWVFASMALIGLRILPFSNLPDAIVAGFITTVFLICTIILTLNSFLIVLLAYNSQQRDHRLLAIAFLGSIILGSYNLFSMMFFPDQTINLVAYSSLLMTVFLSVVLAMRLTGSIREIESFNEKLNVRIQKAEAHLAATLKAQHQIEMQHTKLNERVKLAHDLHDSLGSTIVRSITLLEQNPASPKPHPSLSMLKLLRNDLRQIIDHFSGTQTPVPQTPILWLAPLRHRFGPLFEELDMHLNWHVSSAWTKQPTAAQCMALFRIVEESLTNIVKHSQAQNVCFDCHCTDNGIHLVIKDDGVGFDVKVTEQSGISIGMNSMKARIQRLNGHLDIQSQPKKTKVEVIVYF